MKLEVGDEVENIQTGQVGVVVDVDRGDIPTDEEMLNVIMCS